EHVAELLGRSASAGREQIDSGPCGQRGAPAQEQCGGLGIGPVVRRHDLVLRPACPLHGDPLVCVRGSVGACATQITLLTLYSSGQAPIAPQRRRYPTSRASSCRAAASIRPTGAAWTPSIERSCMSA